MLGRTSNLNGFNSGLEKFMEDKAVFFLHCQRHYVLECWEAQFEESMLHSGPASSLPSHRHLVLATGKTGFWLGLAGLFFPPTASLHTVGQWEISFLNALQHSTDTAERQLGWSLSF